MIEDLSFKVTVGMRDEGAQSLENRRCSVSKSFMADVVWIRLWSSHLLFSWPRGNKTRRGNSPTYCSSLPGQAPDHTCPRCRWILHPSSWHQLLLSAKTQPNTADEKRPFIVPFALPGVSLKQPSQHRSWMTQETAIASSGSPKDQPGTPSIENKMYCHFHPNPHEWMINSGCLA